MKDKIPEFLKDKFLKRKAIASKFPEDIKQFLINYAKHYDWDLSNISERASKIQLIYLLISKGISDLPKCELNDCENNVRIIGEGKLTKGCCHAHSQKISVFKKYGVDNVAKLDSVKTKKTETCFKKYGAKHNWSKGTTSRKKYKKTMIEKYGVEYPMQLEETRKKRRKTFKKKYGAEEITASEYFKNKCMENYGVRNPTLNPTIFKKAKKNSFKIKEYIWKTGEVSFVQGYEPIVLSELEKNGYKFDDIITDECLMPEIWYLYEGKKHRYYPDLYIPKENLIIEVKSDYTLNLDLNKNKAKFSATKKLGFDFQLMVR